MLNFDLETEIQGDSALVRIRGDFDLQVAEKVSDALTEIESGEPKLLVLDLSPLSFLDSTGMGVIAAAHMRAVDAGRQLVIVTPPVGVRRAFELSGLDEVITMVDRLAAVKDAPFGD